MGFILTVLKAFTAAWNVWKQEREVHNRPDIVKERTAQNIQLVKERLVMAEAILVDPEASPEKHLAALREIRLAHS